MDKVISARVDERIAATIGLLARRLRISKKKVIEDAIRAFARSLDEGRGIDPVEVSFGAWARSESAEETVAKARNAFNEAMSGERGQ